MQQPFLLGVFMTIYLDAMGGDNAPVEIIKGAVDAVKEYRKCFYKQKIIP